MPRLIGKTSKTPLYTTILIVVAVSAVTGLEYIGAIDIVPGFGRDNTTMRVSNLATPSMGRTKLS
jgi:hypothetical protein